ncbi:uncharacterized protein LOC6525494 isoform X1 [Drosophila yakuba]|uniref:Uncharacterized protein n=1 Tax=Drosophila yakuba TaxID=7245 RepID=B4Q1E8_DROYA|nr:uncharacterized protein LOC6525494 isoform X1 [Drosophila yakuba]EDX02437.1 uncharacterized protein Dyak_GE17564 [Drosophila yakuba]
MLLKTVSVNGVQHVYACMAGQQNETLTIHVLQPGENRSYSETLAKHDYQQRLKTLNARVKFPEASVRVVLVSEDPLHAEQQLDKHPNTIWKLKYAMANSAVPLKWEWHLSPTDAAQFYCQICMNSMSTASGLRDQVSLLLEILKAKDKELKQYRTEGCQLRRVTAVTKPFDFEGFMNEHQQVLDSAAAYQKVQSVFADGEPTRSLSAFSSPSAQDVKPKTPSTGYSASSETSSPKVTPRLRKRKALEINTNHMERKVMQRRSNPQIEYRSSQSSQETIVDDYFTEIVPTVKKGAIDDDEKPSTSAGLFRGGSAKLTKVNATLGNGVIKSELASQDEIGSDAEGEAKDEEETFKFIIQKVESIQELCDSPKASVQEPKTQDSPVGELDELRATLLHSADLTQKLIQKLIVDRKKKD